MKDKYAHKSDCSIERNSNYSGLGYATMFDSDGHKVMDVSDNWTDEQMFEALTLMNHSFSEGVKVGVSRKEFEIRKVLGINHPS